MVRAAILPADEAAILSFIEGLQNFELALEPGRRPEPGFAAAHWALIRERAGQGAILIAQADGGGALGWALVHDAYDLQRALGDRQGFAFLAELYVAQAARGQGHGRALIAACEDWARARGHRHLIVNVMADNEQARRIYGQGGYAPYSINLRKYL